MVLIGLKARWAALVLAVFTACTIIFVYPFWEGGADQIANRTEALHNLSILGGLLLIVAVGAGPSSVDDR
jgi:putative oxidoreductase